MKISEVRARVRFVLPRLLLALLAALPCVLILRLGLPAWFPGWMTEETTGVPLSSSRLTPFPLRQMWTLGVAGTVVGLLQLRGPWSRWCSLAALLAALAASQVWLWQSGLSKYVLLGGLLPFSDAGVYTEYANQIAQAHQVKYSLQDRPMFPSLMGSLWVFCGGDRYLTLTFILLLAGVSMHLALRSVRAWFGGLSAVVFLMVLLLFYARWIGTTMTEQLGFILGLLACGPLLRGYWEKRQLSWLIGITLLTLALCARAGAFFVLPALCVAAFLHFRDERGLAWKLSGKALTAIFATMLASRFLAFCIFDADNFPRSNFCYTAYGVVHYQNWAAAMEKYGADRDKINQAVLKRIRKHPSSVPLGMWRAWKTFFIQSYGFCFMGRGYSVLLQSCAIVAFLLACFRKVPASALAIAICVGVGSSIPFAPPADADIMRVYAATIPLQALVAALGAGGLANLFGSLAKKTQRHARVVESDLSVAHDDAISTAGGMLIVLLAFVIPISRLVFFPPTKREKSFERVAHRPSEIPRGSYLHLISDDAPRLSLSELRLRDFRDGLANHRLVFEKESAALATLEAGVTLVSGGFRLLLIPTEKFRVSEPTVDFEIRCVGSMTLAVDRDLQLPFPTTPPPY